MNLFTLVKKSTQVISKKPNGNANETIFEPSDALSKARSYNKLVNMQQKLQRRIRNREIP